MVTPCTSRLILCNHLATLSHAKNCLSESKFTGLHSVELTRKCMTPSPNSLHHSHPPPNPSTPTKKSPPRPPTRTSSRRLPWTPSLPSGDDSQSPRRPAKHKRPGAPHGQRSGRAASAAWRHDEELVDLGARRTVHDRLRGGQVDGGGGGFHEPEQKAVVPMFVRFQ